MGQPRTAYHIGTFPPGVDADGPEPDSPHQLKATRAGKHSLPTEVPAAEIPVVHTVDVGGQPLIITTHSEPTSTGSCCAVKFGPTIVEQVGILQEPTSGCAPQPAIDLKCGRRH